MICSGARSPRVLSSNYLLAGNLLGPRFIVKNDGKKPVAVHKMKTSLILLQWIHNIIASSWDPMSLRFVIRLVSRCADLRLDGYTKLAALNFEMSNVVRGVRDILKVLRRISINGERLALWRIRISGIGSLLLMQSVS